MQRPEPNRFDIHPYFSHEWGSIRRFEDIDFDRERRRARKALWRAVVLLCLLFGGMAVASHLGGGEQQVADQPAGLG